MTRKLKSLTTKGLFELDMEATTSEKPADFFVTLEIKEPKVPFFFTEPDLREAILRLRVVHEGKTLFNETSDFTDLSSFMSQIRVTDSYLTAFHEAAHIILNDPQVSGEKFVYTTIKPSDGYLGYARSEKIPGFLTAHTQKSYRARLVTLVGGSEAEKLLGRSTNSGQAGDLEEANSLLTRVAVNWGFVPELQGARINKDGVGEFSESQKEVYAQFAKTEFDLARAEARRELLRQWYLLRIVAGDLHRRHEIHAARYDELRAQVAKKPRAFIDQYRAKYGPASIISALDRIDSRNCSEILGGEIDNQILDEFVQD